METMVSNSGAPSEVVIGWEGAEGKLLSSMGLVGWLQYIYIYIYIYTHTHVYINISPYLKIHKAKHKISALLYTHYSSILKIVYVEEKHVTSV
jgi:hypothetical protein